MAIFIKQTFFIPKECRCTLYETIEYQLIREHIIDIHCNNIPIIYHLPQNVVIDDGLIHYCDIPICRPPQNAVIDEVKKMSKKQQITILCAWLKISEQTICRSYSISYYLRTITCVYLFFIINRCVIFIMHRMLMWQPSDSC